LEKCRNTKNSEEILATMEKEGVNTGFFAINPMNGEEIPIWIANFVLMEYGTGAIMSVPAHDQRDLEFAKQYNIQIKQVIKPVDGSQININQTAFTERGVLFDSGEFSNLNFDDAFTAIATHLEKNSIGEIKTNYRLRDWGISRQRYWGTPIPIINCDKCGQVAVPKKVLPVILPENIKLDDPKSPLLNLKSFVDTTCPKCSGKAKRETDTFDTFMESSWYYLRYCCPDQTNSMVDERANYWMPVDQYIGGIEHAVMHLLYARFIYKVIRDEGLVNSDEPFTNLLTQGMVLKDGVKMSKSKNNIVSPLDLLNDYGSDTMRLFSIFASPPEQTLEWSHHGIEGSFRFLKKLYNFALANEEIVSTYDSSKTGYQDLDQEQKKIYAEIHTVLYQANQDMERLHLNTVVSAAMKILNMVHNLANDKNYAAVIHESLAILLRILNPITPHITHYLWQELKFGGDIATAPWPKTDQNALTKNELTLMIQINGKLRGKITVSSDANEKTIKETALAEETVARLIEQKTVKKIIVVPKKLVNIVVS